MTESLITKIIFFFMEKEPTPGTQKARPSITSMKTSLIITSLLMVILEKEFKHLHSLQETQPLVYQLLMILNFMNWTKSTSDN